MSNYLTINFQKVAEKFKYKMLLHAIFNRLASIGIEVKPYYIVAEGLPLPNKLLDISAPEFLTSSPDFLTKEEIGSLLNDSEISIRSADENNRCFALKHHSDIIAVSWCIFDKYEIFNKSYSLQSNEVYLCSANTLKKYRGNNLAPYLRLQLYKRLSEMGYNKIYSFTEAFNTAAIKFKKKLGAIPKEFCIYINVLGKFKKTFLIKRYRLS